MRVAITNGVRVRECEEADLPHFAAQGYRLVVEAEQTKPAEVEPQQAKPKRRGK